MTSHDWYSWVNQPLGVPENYLCWLEDRFVIHNELQLLEIIRK